MFKGLHALMLSGQHSSAVMHVGGVKKKKVTHLFNIAINCCPLTLEFMVKICTRTDASM